MLGRPGQAQLDSILLTALQTELQMTYDWRYWNQGSRLGDVYHQLWAGTQRLSLGEGGAYNTNTLGRPHIWCRRHVSGSFPCPRVHHLRHQGCSSPRLILQFAQIHREGAQALLQTQVLLQQGLGV